MGLKLSTWGAFLFGSMCLAAQQVAAGAEYAPLEEVIVTARKRVESVQDVPAAISVLSEEKLQLIGADDFEGFARTVPGLSLNRTSGVDLNVNMRGVSTGSFRDFTQSTVAFYIDDLPTMDSFLSWATTDLRLSDINRVEVLRGPQGTLFGSGSLAGAIRVITNKPDLHEQEFELGAGGVSVDHGGVGYTADAMANLPLVDGRFAIRAVGYLRDDPGYLDNIETGEQDSNHGEVWGARLMGRFQATDDLQLTATLSTQSTRSNDSPAAFALASDGGTYERASSIALQADVDLSSVNLLAEYDFGPATLTSSSTYGETSADVLRDALTRFFQLSFGPDVIVPDNEFNTTDIYAQELRLASNGDSRIKYVVGAFYQKREYDGGQRFFFLGTNPLPGVTLAEVDVNHEVEEQALFGELTFALTDRLELTAGARAFKNNYHMIDTSTGLILGLNGVTRVHELSSDDDGINPKVSVSYKLSPDKMVYATAAKGYRTGFVNLQLAPTPVEPYEPDTLWNYELGYKSYMLDRKVMLNAAVYYIDWKNIQAAATKFITVNGSTLALQGTTNVGDAWTEGVEIEAAWQALESLQLSTAFSVGDTRLTSINPGIVIASLPDVGSELPASPNFSISSSAQYSYTLGAWGNYLRAEHQYVGRSLSNFETAPANLQPLPMGDYTLVNLRAGFIKGNLEIVAYVNNLLGSEGQQVTTRGNALPPTYSGAILVMPRQIGTTVRLRF